MITIRHSNLDKTDRVAVINMSDEVKESNLTCECSTCKVDEVNESNLTCKCSTCKRGESQHTMEDNEFEFDFEDDAHWAWMRPRDEADEVFLEECAGAGLLDAGPAKVRRLFEFGQACETLGTLEEIKAAVVSWRLNQTPQLRDRSPKRVT